MSNMTAVNFYDYLLRTFKRTDKATEVYEAITDTIMDMKIQFEWETFKEEAYSTSIAVLGDYKLVLPTDFGHLIGDVKILETDDCDSYPLNKLSKPLFDTKYPNPNSTVNQRAKPVDYCIFGDQIFIGPIPDKITYTYEFSYTTEEATQFDNTSTAIPFTGRYRECVKAGVLYRLYALLEQDDEAMKWKSIHNDHLVKAIENEKNNTRTTIIQQYNDL